MRESIFSDKISPSEIMYLAKDLSSSLKAGFSLEETMNDITTKSSGKMASITRGMQKEIANGLSLQKAVEKYPQYFSAVFCSMIEIGELSGNLPLQLDEIYQEAKREDEIQEEIKKMLLTPRFVMIIGFVLVFINLVFLIPLIREGLDAANMDSRTQGQFLTSIFEASALFTNHFQTSIFLFVGGMVLVWVLFSTNFFRLLLLEVFSVLPSMARFFKNKAKERFFKAVSLFIAAGISIIPAFKKGGELSEDRDLKEIGEVLSFLLDQGEPLLSSLKKFQYFETSTLAKISDAEKTGDFSGGFHELAESFYKEGQYQLEVGIRKIKLIVKFLIFTFAFLQIFLIVLVSIQSLFTVL